MTKSLPVINPYSQVKFNHVSTISKETPTLPLLDVAYYLHLWDYNFSSVFDQPGEIEFTFTKGLSEVEEHGVKELIPPFEALYASVPFHSLKLLLKRYL